jgi:hypothetical protein
MLARLHPVASRTSTAMPKWRSPAIAPVMINGDNAFGYRFRECEIGGRACQRRRG